MNSFKTFNQLHQGQAPFILGNIWDVNSAKVFEANNYKAIGVSSQALSNAMGYDDGENLPFEIVLQLAKKVVEAVRIPFSVDMEGGYSRKTNDIIENITKLHDVGVAGINLEDTIPRPTRKLLPAAEFQKTLEAIADHIRRNNLQLFVNVRTDGFLLGLPSALTETLDRIKAYENTGANGIFVPCITAGNDIEAVVKSTRLPINVMCMPALPDFDVLKSLGVKRISMGPFLFNSVYSHAGKLAKAIIDDNNFLPIL
ncbi:MAG: isocitrate lyase/phosphoenolpyruvate mutase family protein [Bacteroidota bacterium]